MNQQRLLRLCMYSVALLLLLLGLEGAYGFAPQFLRPDNGRSTTSLQTTSMGSSSSSSSSSDDDFMSELRQRIHREYASYVPMDVADIHTQKVFGHSTNNERRRLPDKVHIVVFQAGTTNQGAHTIEYPKGSGNNIVLAFESYDACYKFASSLAEQNFVDPSPRQYRLREVQHFFSTVGVWVQVVPMGIELKPPTQNVPKFGHDPTLCQTKQYLDYLFAMTHDDDEDDDWDDVMDETAAVVSEGAWE